MTTDESKIREKISQIAQRRRNVTFDDIHWVVKQIGGEVVRKTRHGYLFRVGSRRFMVNAHHPGSKQVKAYSVDDFLDAMRDLGWYGDS